MKVSLKQQQPLLCPVPVVAIGSYNDADIANMMTASWVGTVCSKPHLISVSIRAQTQTYENLMINRCFTLSIPDESQLNYIDFMGAYSGKKIEKLKELNFGEIKSKLIHAPYIEEFPIVFECEVRSVENLGSHTLFIAEVLDIKIDENLLDDRHNILEDGINPAAYFHHLRSYRTCKDRIYKRGAFLTYKTTSTLYSTGDKV